MATFSEQRVEPGARYREGERPTMAKLAVPVILALALGFGLGWAMKPEREVVPDSMTTTTPFSETPRTTMPSDSLAPSLPAPFSPSLTEPSSPSGGITEPSTTPGGATNP